MLTHFQRVMVAAQVYACGCVSERQAVKIGRKLEALTADEPESLPRFCPLCQRDGADIPNYAIAELCERHGHLTDAVFGVRGNE